MTSDVPRIRMLQRWTESGNSAGPTLNGVIFAAITIVALYMGRVVFVPLALAILLSFILSQPVLLLRRLYIPRTAAVMMVVVLAFSIIFGIGAVIGNQVLQLSENIPQYQRALSVKIARLRGAEVGSGALGRAAKAVKELGNDLAKPVDPSPSPGRRTEGTPEQPLIVEVRPPSARPLETIQTIIGTLLEPLAAAGIVIVFVLFILLQREDLRDRIIRLAGARDIQRTTIAMNDAAQRLSRYLLIQTLINGAFGVVIGLGLWWIGIPNPALWGILSMLMRFVPYVGTIFAAAFPIILAAAVDPTWSTLLWTLGLYLVTEPLMGQVIEPLIQGQTTGLSALAVVVSAAFWTLIWGPIGLLLAMPLTVCLVVLGRHVDRLEFLHIILGDDEVLTPQQAYYQRILAGNANEAALQAEDLLKEQSLSSYYESVALEGLKLAQLDAERGAFDRERLTQIRDTVDEVVDDLAEHDDVGPSVPTEQTKAADNIAALHNSPETKEVSAPVQPKAINLRPEWAAPSAILCVPGHSPLDEAAALMLAQLLGKHGFGATVTSFDVASPQYVMRLDGTGVRVILLSSLDGNSRPAQMRYFIRRLRRRFPAVKFVACMWMFEGDESAANTLQTTIGADQCATSLRTALELCISMASGEELQNVSSGR